MRVANGGEVEGPSATTERSRDPDAAVVARGRFCERAVASKNEVAGERAGK